ncbi:MAG: cell wall hydrolase [Alphaproteobacteria bacterium]|nr:cell wall hydrolase [Alphaproteobacteria bacterium]
MSKIFKICSLIALGLILFANDIIAQNKIYKYGTEMDKYRLAVMLSYEIGGALKEESVAMVANTVINRYNTAKKFSDKNLTITDVLYQSGQYSSGPSAITGPYTKNYTKDQLNAVGLKQLGATKWNRALKVAEQAMNGTLRDYVNGGYSYNKSFVKGGTLTGQGQNQINTKLDTNPLWKEGGQIVGHRFYKYNNDKLLGAIPHRDYNMDPNAGSGQINTDGVIQYDTETGKPKKMGQVSVDNPDGKSRSGICSMTTAASLYLSDGITDNACWYCKIVVVITNAYFKAAYAALPSAVTLGKLCAKLGFMIWLAYYILLQVSSLSPITPFKMLQEILVMGFKVSLAYLGVIYATSVITQYFVNPIVGLGVEYGSAMLNSMIDTYGVDNTLESIQEKIDNAK